MSPTTTTRQTDHSPDRDESLAIDAQDVHVTYGDGTEAVKGVDLAVRSGEFFGFLGPNGAGKTTIIKTLSTLLHPTQGSIRIDGADVETETHTVRQSIGYMAQETSVDEELTARENVRFACEVYGVPSEERDERIEALLELVNLTEDADRRAETFSGGMKKRLDAATVLVHRPPVVFLDEPTTGLDPEARIQFWEYLRDINDRGTTVFLTTQYLEEIDRLCDRLALLEDGRIVAVDTPQALKSSVGGEVLDLVLAEPTDAEKHRAGRIVRRSDAVEATRIEPTDDGITVTAADAHGGVSGLVVTLHEAGLTVTGFDIYSPTLEHVFLQLTDADAEAVGAETTPGQDVPTAPEVVR